MAVCRILPRIAAMWGICAVTTAVAPASAAPDGDGTNDLAALACTFAVTSPRLTTVPGGAQAVTSQMAPDACTPKSVPFTSTICVAAPDGSNFCKTANSWNTAEVFATSSRFTGTFTASGNGCSRVTVGNSTQLICVPVGPLKLNL